MYIKISNLIDLKGIADYKGLDLDMIHSGTQLYPEGTNEAYFYYNGDMLTHEDIVEIDEATYNGVKQNEINKITGESMPEKIKRLEIENTALLSQQAAMSADFQAFMDMYFEQNPTA
jgi:hypothetical protein